MKKLLSILFIIAFALTACGGQTNGSQTGSGQKSAAQKERTASTDKMTQVLIPAGSFQMGGLTDKASEDEEPDHKVTLKAFWMDKTEVTNAQYAECVQAGVCDIPNELKSTSRDAYFASADFANYPVIYVTWNDAGNYCKWAGRRLPTEAEWEYAARGTDYRSYPWGDTEPTDELANFNYKVRDTAAVGSYPKGASPFGILDMAGNVWEWVSDFYSQTYYRESPAENPLGPETAGANGLRMSLRGGSWMDGVADLRVSNRGFGLAQNLEADKLSNSYAGESNDHIGFRCAADE
jgi:eukaryotic-like serine/threonine-protein kinase